MKNPSTILSLLAILCFLPLILSAQNECKGSFTEHYLNANNIRASFFARGNKFTDGSRPLFFAPYSTEHPVSSIFASTPWFGGFDDAGNLKMAAETYPNSAATDFRVGPLSSIGTPFDSVCQFFDRVWNIYSEDIIAHRNDYFTDFDLDDTIASVFGWPGRGNPFFEKYNGFKIPSFDNQGMASFRDSNGNGIYNPDQGDYPVVYNTNHSAIYVPDQILWMVFNDVAVHQNTGADPVRMEVQLTAYAFHCLDNEMLNNTIFNSYKLINRAVSAIDSFYFGMWTDYDLGCSEDDFVGSDSTRNTEFVYNADPLDGDDESFCSSGAQTYAPVPPVQSMTYLNRPMHSFITYDAPQPIGLEMHNALNGLWRDGNLIVPEGEGYNPSSSATPTKFLFSGDPRDTSSWSAINVLDKGKDLRTVSSIKIGRLDPGKVTNVLVAYQYHHDPNRDHLGQITTMHENVDQLLATIDHLDITCLEVLSCPNKNDCVWPGDFNHDGIADHFDLLQWGVMNESTGESRTPRVNWRGYAANNWAEETSDGLNYKHGDASGNGVVNLFDLDINVLNYLDTIPSYLRINKYPQGPELVVSATAMTPDGKIPSVQISTATEINNVLGMAYEVEFDTSIFELNTRFITRWPSASNWIGYYDGFYNDGGAVFTYSNKYGFVQADHQGLNIEAGSELQRTFSRGLTLKEGLTIEDVPDSTVIRLRNLIAIDAEGNNLDIGANELIVQKYGITGIKDLDAQEINIFPNPTHYKLFIDAPDQTKAEFINPQGQILKSFLTGNDPVDVSAFAPGIYFLRFPQYGLVKKVVIE